MVRRYSKKAAKTVKGAISRRKRGTSRTPQPQDRQEPQTSDCHRAFRARRKGQKFSPQKGRQKEIKRSRAPAGTPP